MFHWIAHRLGINKTRGEVQREVPLTDGMMLRPGERLGQRRWDGKRQMWWGEIEKVVCVRCVEKHLLSYLEARIEKHAQTPVGNGSGGPGDVSSTQVRSAANGTETRVDHPVGTEPASQPLTLVLSQCLVCRKLKSERLEGHWAAILAPSAEPYTT